MKRLFIEDLIFSLVIFAMLLLAYFDTKMNFFLALAVLSGLCVLCAIGDLIKYYYFKNKK